MTEEWIWEDRKEPPTPVILTQSACFAVRGILGKVNFLLIPAHNLQLNSSASYQHQRVKCTIYLCVCVCQQAGAVFKHVPLAVSLLHNDNNKQQLTTKTPSSPSILQPSLVPVGFSNAKPPVQDSRYVWRSQCKPAIGTHRPHVGIWTGWRRLLYSTSKECCSRVTVSVDSLLNTHLTLSQQILFKFQFETVIQIILFYYIIWGSSGKFSYHCVKLYS